MEFYGSLAQSWKQRICQPGPPQRPCGKILMKTRDMKAPFNSTLQLLYLLFLYEPLPSFIKLWPNKLNSMAKYFSLKFQHSPKSESYSSHESLLLFGFYSRHYSLRKKMFSFGYLSIMFTLLPACPPSLPLSMYYVYSRMFCFLLEDIHLSLTTVSL